ncbi:mitochondrial sodium/calcium exchanger protein-like [Uloborus diversus]|uniref:mitochondrial sodium/calcium exchanger protein-like n=1 Tax=Uloborus diversus TaxID=327109 RepID=UPI00240A5D91|nr:mitochondrial sodium/calcium exchanger protein-like [Uloborus diversus]
MAEPILIQDDENSTFPFDIDAECTEIHTINSSLQCFFAMTVEDCVEIIEYLDYNYYAFCSLDLQHYVPVTITLFLWLLMLFIALGVTSNYFLCPALFTISNHLGLSQNMAGVTLLAFGNASPDIFSSVAGLHKASAELAVASLVGAGVFVTSVVAGSVFMTGSFDLMVRPFLRDIAFYMMAISWAFGLFFTGRKYLYHGIGFVLLYFVYILVVLGSRYIYVTKLKQKDKKSEKEEIKSKEIEKSGDKENPETKEDDTRKIKGFNYDDDLDAAAVVLKAFYFGGFEWADGRRLSKANLALESRRLSNKSNVYSIESNGTNSFGSCQSIQSNGMSSTEKLNPSELESRSELWDFMVKVCPVNTKKWHQLKWWKKLIAIVRSPAILIMRLTVPVLDAGEEDFNWNRYLICTQCITGPVFISLVTEYAFHMIGGVFPFFVLLLCVCIACSVFVYCRAERHIPPNYHWLFAYLGFAVSVTWIYCLANEIVALLQVFGVIYNLSDSILGLTILAWGNSLSDFLSNVAVARKGYPRMAISACFGGPLLALLLGLGVPCIIEIAKGRAPAKYPLHFSAQFAFLFCTIGISLLTTVSVMSAWKFKTKRLYGVLLITLYIAFVSLSVIEELDIFTVTL